ncbi:hypothetical protein [Hyalangium rubrum]|uniref:Flagellar motor switch protein FliG C-terminal domain-containing protein n=1 Tax=Hyalangium rubrum TaxID=3103134 RepID=A0ABU5GYC0_9BACT|nr:hypothetical protein [Hyalangium sp. s54d21]MDY7225537.1 hypothetical protein [Hyalangium sp. s54d21]
MDQLLTSLNKRQTMLLLTAITFGGQEGVAALEQLAPEEAELLQHRAQGIMQIPREKRIPLLVQEIKRLVKDRRGQLWSAEPEKLAALLQKERGALVEVVLRALPSVLAEAVRAHMPQKPVKLTREVRPQVLDIVRWKLEERLARSAGGQVSFKFSDVLMLQPREMFTVCDRLGARVLGPALAGLADTQREPLIAQLPPDMKLLASKSVAANAPRKLPEEEAKAQLEVHDGLKNLSSAIRSAGVQRLARACVAQSAEFAARMVERHRGEFGSLLAKWVRDERTKPSSRANDGGRSDIVADLERLAVRGLIERPVRLTPARPALNPPPVRSSGAQPAPPSSGREPAPSVREQAPSNREQAPSARDSAPPSRTSGREARPSVPPPPAPRRDIMAEREARRAGVASASSQAEGGVRRDPMAERAARRAGALSFRDPRENAEPLGEGSPEGSRRQPRVGVPPEPGTSRRGAMADPAGARVGPPPVREGSRTQRPLPPEVGEGSRTSRPPPPEVGEGSRTSRPPPSEVGEASRAGSSRRPPPEVGSRAGGASERVSPRPVERSGGAQDPEASRVISSPGARSRGTGVRPELAGEEPERPPRVLTARPSSSSLQAIPSKGEGTSVGRRPRNPPSGNSGRGPRGGTR